MRLFQWRGRAPRWRHPYGPALTILNPIKGSMAAINSVTDLVVEGDLAVLTLNSPPVNALSYGVRDGIALGVAEAIADPAVKAVVLICDGRTFIAGADITEIGGAHKGATLFDVQSIIENSPKPVVAAIHGTALGGGLEVAMTCHYRVAVPSAKCGQPEVLLGIIPGAGGTQRLPRLAGVAMALEMCTLGQHVSAQRALEAGVLDAIVEGDLLTGAIEFARGKTPRKVRDIKIGEAGDAFE